MLQHPECSEYNAVLCKSSAVIVLEYTLEAQEEWRKKNAAIQVLNAGQAAGGHLRTVLPDAANPISRP